MADARTRYGTRINAAFMQRADMLLFELFSFLSFCFPSVFHRFQLSPTVNVAEIMDANIENVSN